MKKVLLIVLMAVLFFPSNLMAGLQDDSLVNNLVERFREVVAERGGDPESIVRENIVIQRSIPFDMDISGQILTMYAVRLLMSIPDTGQKQHVTMIVDRTGTIQLDGAFVDLITGRSIHQGVMNELNRVEHDLQLGDILYKGSGRAEVLFLSDPFCPYCRHAYEFFLTQKNRVDELRIAHFPLDPGSGAVALTFLMMDHKDNDNFQKVVDFAYKVDRNRLAGNPDHEVIRVFNEKFNTYPGTPEEVFVYLTEKHQNSLARDMEDMRGIGLSGTPMIIIDGVKVEGFNRNRVTDLLNQQGDQD